MPAHQSRERLVESLRIKRRQWAARLPFLLVQLADLTHATQRNVLHRKSLQNASFSPDRIQNVSGRQIRHERRRAQALAPPLLCKSSLKRGGWFVVRVQGVVVHFQIPRDRLTKLLLILPFQRALLGRYIEIRLTVKLNDLKNQRIGKFLKILFKTRDRLDDVVLEKVVWPGYRRFDNRFANGIANQVA